MISQSAQDIEFQKVQVDWIISTNKIKDLEQVMSWREANVLRQLDCNDYVCRRLAKDELKTVRYEVLIWGMRTKNKQIVHECTLLLDLKYICKICNGSGKCVYCGPNNSSCKRCDWKSNCSECRGSGDTRYELKYLDGFDKAFERKLF